MLLSKADRKHFNMFYPHRPFPKGFCPSSGSHDDDVYQGSVSELCVMEAISWSQGRGITDIPLCVHYRISSLFIELNDFDADTMDGEIMRSFLFSIAHRCLGTSYIPTRSLVALEKKTMREVGLARILADDFREKSGMKVNLFELFRREHFSYSFPIVKGALTTFLDNIDEWCKVHRPTLYAKRLEAIPLPKISAKQAALLQQLSAPIPSRKKREDAILVL